MVNPWRKYKSVSKRKKQTLHSVIVGFVLFCVFYFITKFLSIPLCPIKTFFGLSCPGCGLTRGFLAILRFDFFSAYNYNILSIPLFFGIMMYSLLCISDIIFNRSDIEKIEHQCKKPYMIIFFVLLFVLCTYINYKKIF